MKNSIKYIAALAVALLVIWACDKEVNIISSFDFTLEESHEEESTINFAQRTTLTVVPEKVVNSAVYSLKYEVLDGEGVYLDANGNELPNDEFIQFDSLRKELFYKGGAVNQDNVRITVRDGEGKEKTIEILYNVKHNEYTLEATTPINQVNVNESRSFSVSIFNTGKDKSVTHERAFFLIQGSGEITNADESQEIEKEKYEPIIDGTYGFNIQLLEPGESKLVVATRDSNGQVKNDTLTYNVNVVDFAFTADPAKNSAFVGEDVNVNFTLNENQGSGGQYQMRYVIEEGNITMTSGGSPVQAGTLTNVSLGNFSWTASIETQQLVRLKFFVRNESGVEKEGEVTINVNSGSFEFDPVPVTTSTFINNKVTFNSSITQIGPAAPPYNLTFSSTGNGTVEYNGTTYAAGQIIPNLTVLAFSFDYTGTSVGQHDIVFTLKNANGITVIVQRELTFSAGTFDFNPITSQSTANLNESITINSTITETGGGQSPYSLTFSSTGTGTMEYNGSTYSAGQTIPNITSLAFSMDYTGSTSGQHQISLTLTNSNGLPVSKTVTITYNVTTFDFSAATTLTSIKANNPATQNFNLTQTGTEPLTYTLSFTSTGTGTLAYNGVTYNQGQIIAGIVPGSFSGEYTGTSVGGHAIKYRLTASNGDFIEKTVNIDVEVDPFLTVNTWSLPDTYLYGNRTFRDLDVGFSNNFIETNPELTGDLKMKWEQTGSGGQIDAINLNYLIINSIGTPSSVNATPEDTFVNIPNNQDFTILFNYARIGAGVGAGNFDQFLFTITNGFQTVTYQIRFITTAP
ncbi:TraQ conjugal transfer family protein [Maribacter sp. 4G9]|uniref:TraQ conjugal transfer family protein n=1 Tax=Maribacter sp. 4G9 TaxID=1889777 RepID=UPI000C149D39|nr:TraQ conjugal transfer family protein [Maribacter sp. 4G9]PIB39071.1 hypothetical protein BFP75_00925 [Maribacter sp. 4G9]